MATHQTLRETIASIENSAALKKQRGGCAAPKEAQYDPLSHCQIQQGVLNEIIPKTYRDRIAALGTLMANLASVMNMQDGPVIWCQLRDPDRLHLHAPGLAAFGLDPARITKVTLQSEKDLLWSVEETAASGAATAVVGILWSEKHYDFTASKRLRMRARETDTSIVMVRSHRANGTTAADTRLSVSSHPCGNNPPQNRMLGHLGNPEWHINLLKSRVLKSGGPHHVQWHPEKIRFDMVAPLADRATKPQIWPMGNFRQTG